MTHGQLTRRITAIVSQLNNLSTRLDALTTEAAESAPKAKGKAKAKAPKQAGAKRASVIGASIVYGGVKGKVLERKGSKFLCEMADGKRRQVSTVYVYRQLSKSVKPKVAKQDQPAQQELPATQQAAPQPAPQPAPVAEQPQDQQQKAS